MTERIDIPENDEEAAWLAKQNFENTAEDAYTGRSKMTIREQLKKRQRERTGMCASMAA